MEFSVNKCHVLHFTLKNDPNHKRRLSTLARDVARSTELLHHFVSTFGVLYSFWSPWYAKDVIKLESVQRKLGIAKTRGPEL